MKATNIQWESAKKGGFVTAYLNDTPEDPKHALQYQEWFESEPSKLRRDYAVRSFELNYKGLNKQARIPVKVKQHHSDIA